MKYKILHLPTGTLIKQTILNNNFFNESESDGSTNYLDYYDDTSRFDRLLELVDIRSDYFTGWEKAIPEHFEMVEVEDDKI